MKTTVVNIESKNVLAKLMATENIHIEHKKVSTASFDVKNRRLILPIWKNMTNTLYEGLIGHEVGHALYTPHDEWMKFCEEKENKNLKGYANILEDARIERKMKIKYPGMKKTFFGMYDSLSQRDFFGTKGRDLEEYGFADRLNLDFKLGVLAEVPFSDEEKDFRDRVLKAETFEEILTLTKELGEMAKDESETNMDDMGCSAGDETESNEDEDVEPNDTAPFPMPSPSDEENPEEEEPDYENGIEEIEEGEGNTPDSESEESDEKGEEKEAEANPEEGADTEHETSPDLEPAPPEPETQKAWDEAMEAMNDEEAKEPVYLDLPLLNPEKAIIPWKDTFEELNIHWLDPENFSSHRWHYEDVGDERWKTEEENKFRVWKKDTAQIVNYMVKEFEMKQAATEYRRTSISKTGVLDMNKLHLYRTDEDIFKRVTAVKDGRNHALLIYIDWSGSMHNKMEATVKQTLTLVMFAKKVGIPFRVYSFSNSNQILDKIEKKEFYDRSIQDSDDHLIPGRLGMHEYFNEKMSGREFNTQLKNLAFLGKSLDYSGMITPTGHGTCSTPLNECIMAATEMVSDFKKETGAEKINAIFLTDGGADYCSDYWNSDIQEKKQVHSLSSSHSKRGTYMVLRDPKTKRLVHTDRSRDKLTDSLLKNLGDKHQINVIGFHITNKSTINHQIHYEVGYGEGSELKSFLNKNGYVPFKKSGYATYFLINDKSLDQEAIFDDPAHNADGSIAKGKLRTQFRKFTHSRKVNKMMLNEFVALVA
jgi:hypothetical protein